MALVSCFVQLFTYLILSYHPVLTNTVYQCKYCLITNIHIFLSNNKTYLILFLITSHYQLAATLRTFLHCCWVLIKYIYYNHCDTGKKYTFKTSFVPLFLFYLYVLWRPWNCGLCHIHCRRQSPECMMLLIYNHCTFACTCQHQLRYQ